MNLSKANMLAFAILAVFATALAPALGADKRNFLVIGLACAMPMLLIASRISLPRADTLWVAAAALYMVAITLARGDLSDFSTVIYTILFALSYLGFASALRTGHITRQSAHYFLRLLILAFAIMSLLQMATSLAGLPVPNTILSKGMWSYNSLSVEPSHLGRVLAISTLVYLVLLRTAPGVSGSPWQLLWQERLVVGAFLTSLLLSGSALAILIVPVVLMLAFPARWMLVPSGVLVLCWPLVLMLDLPALQRGLLFLAALPTLDLQELARADHSASLRVAPALIYFNKMAFGSTDFWLGGGVSAIRPFLIGELSGVGDNIGAGFFPAYLIAFGLLGTILTIWAFILRFFHTATLPTIILWSMLFFASAWNTQLFWYGLMLIRLLHHFEVGKGRQTTSSPSFSSKMGVPA